MFSKILFFPVFALLCFGAQAADYAIPLRPQIYEQPAPPPRQSYDWQRCYVGAQIGTKDVHNDLQMTKGRTPFINVEFITKATTNLIGPIAGGQAGCNMALGDGWLAGVELEGVYGKKNQQTCQTQVDPASYCLDFTKGYEVFLTGRAGYVFKMSGFCQCDDPGWFVYGRAGLGYTGTQIKGNFNANSYLYKDLPDTTAGGYFPPGSKTPLWSQNFDTRGKQSFIGLVLGVGVERPIAADWTLRLDFTTMISPSKASNLVVTKSNFRNGELGEELPHDLSLVQRNHKLGDVIPIKMQELETKMTVGLNHQF